MRSVFRTLFVGLLGLMAASCAQSELAGEPSGGSGPMSRVAFSASVNPQYSLSYASAETSGVDLDQIAWPAASDFALDILSGGSVVESHAAGAVPSELELAVGAYSVRAHSGVNGESWNTPYLAGEEEFSLSASATSVNAKLTCGLKSTLVALVFDENFSTIFSDYTAYLNTEHTTAPWVWVAGEKRVACMRPTQQLLIRVDVTMRSNGSKYNYGINPLVGLKAGELNVVRFSMVGGEVTATITSDNTVTVVEKTVMLQADWLATRKTSISASFDPAVSVEHIYGLPYTAPMDVVVRSNVGLKSLKLKASGDLATLLGATEVDLRGVNEVEAKTGLVLTKAEGAMAYDGRLNFKGCLNTLPVLAGDASAYTFTVEAVDLLDNVVPFDTKINILLPELGARSVDGAKVWNRYAKVPGIPVTDARVPAEYREKFVFEYVIRQGEGPWESLGAYTGSGDIYKNGLKPATTYTTAVDLGGGRYVAEAAFTTTAEQQLVDPYFTQTTTRIASNITTYNMGGYKEPAAWATLNAMTTLNYSTSNYASRAYPCVTVESDGSVLVASRSWGSGNRIQHALTSKGGSDQWGGAIRQNVGVGKLFLGSYDYATNTQNQGWPCTQKPRAICFMYKYLSVPGAEAEMMMSVKSGATEIGRAYWKQSTYETTFTTQEVVVEYDKSFVDLTPTTIELYFVSQNAQPENDNTVMPPKGIDKPGGWSNGIFGLGAKPNWKDTKNSYFEGAALFLKNVELVYLQDITDQYTIK